jgi:gp16 family phage-associated protein
MPVYTANNPAFSLATQPPKPRAAVEDCPPWPQTPETARRWFKGRGIRINEWCAVHGHRLHVVKDLLYGKSAGDRGQADDAALALGLKPGADDLAGPAPAASDNALPLADLVRAIEETAPIMRELIEMGIDVIGLDSVNPKLVTVRNHPLLKSFHAMAGCVIPLENMRMRINVAQYRDIYIRWLDQE